MKLKKLHIPNHKGFVNFQTTFDLSSPITTIIGQNGVGKSNLIEIIVSIFRSIDLGEKTDFDYTLLYECHGNDIQIKVDNSNKPQSLVAVNGTKRSLKYLRDHADECLPNNVFTYYSGTNWRVEELFVKHQTQFYKRLTDGKDEELRRFFYCRDEHSFFVLLAFLVDKDPACLDILGKLGIESLDSVLFCLKKPYWYNGKPSQVQLETGDPRFWYSRGVVKEFLNTLWDYSIAPIDNKERKSIDFRGRTENQDRLYLFVHNDKSLRNFASNYKSSTEFFKHLESTYIADLIEEVSVTVNLTNGQKLTFSALSEGERQLLTVLGLMKFTRDDESLFLLDEPDTHLNPRWKMDYFDRIESILNAVNPSTGANGLESSQILLTTHDPLMLTSLRADQIRVLSECDNSNKISEKPDFDPINQGIEAIIQSELYGIRTSFDREIQRKIDLRNRLASKEILSSKLKMKLMELNNELDAIGISHNHPNPYFSNFAKVMSKDPLFRKSYLSFEEYESAQRKSHDILDKLLKDEGKQ
ncbi:AAA family ATPase [Vibrio splendidus]